ncbi:MAG: aldo/keto reductase [Candidatus Dormibacteraeota bacterium]|nr:aldo/keto reductase [Candidatus Dormibacteraeota bacterium]
MTVTIDRLTDASAGTVTLGDLEVRRLGYGAMRITGQGVWGDPPDREASKTVLRRVVDLGVTFIDTADSYGPGTSEELIAEALHPYPQGLVIGTKAGLVRPAPSRWDPDGRPEYLRAACEDSLRRLRLERIDLYQLHRPDPAVPYEESLGALVELRRQGKIRHIGVSNVDPAQLRLALAIAGPVSVQNRYNLADRESEPVLRLCEEHRLAFLPWFPLATGKLAGPGSPLEGIARRLDATPGQVALAWLLHVSPATLLIPGTNSVDHLEENVAAAAVALSDQDLAELEEASTAARS